MRTPAAQFTTDAAKILTEPGYLLQMDFTAKVYLCTRLTTIWNSKTWQQLGFEISGNGINANGEAQISITLPNKDNAYSAIVLNETISGVLCQLWQIYADPGGGGGTPEPIFYGKLGGVKQIDSNVVITAIATGERLTHSPSIYIAPPTFNHLPPSGTVIQWGGGEITLERR